MSATAYTLLDGPLAYLARDLDGVLAPATMTGPDGRALPLFSSETSAAPHLARLSVVDGVGWVVRAIAADDPRAKEEVLRAAHANGAREVVFDVGEATPTARLPLGLALGYVLGHKRSSACL